MDDKSVIIKIGHKGHSVRFKGVWRRADIDAAYASMLRSLPEYLLKLKQKEATDGK